MINISLKNDWIFVFSFLSASPTKSDPKSNPTLLISIHQKHRNRRRKSHHLARWDQSAALQQWPLRIRVDKGARQD
jgi:hypothetical protein